MMILKFEEFIKENVPYDSFNGAPIVNGPDLTTWSGDNRTQISTDQVVGGNGGQIGGEWYKRSGPSSKGEIFKDEWKPDLEKPIVNRSNKRKKAIEQLQKLLKFDLEKTIDL